MAYIGFHIQASHSTDMVHMDWALVAFQEVLCFQILEEGEWLDMQTWLHRIDPTDPKVAACLPNLTRKLDVANNPLVRYTDKDFGKIPKGDKLPLAKFCIDQLDALKTEYTIVEQQQKVVQ